MKKTLSAIRKKLGLRQLDLALKAGCGVATIWLIENGYAGRVSPKLKTKIAKALGQRVEEVFPKPTETPRISKKKGKGNLG